MKHEKSNSLISRNKTNKIEMDLFGKKCLLCTSMRENLIEIFDTHGRSLKIAEIISKHFWFEVKNNPELNSTSICELCWEHTKDFHEFYCRIEQIFADNVFKQEHVVFQCDATTDVVEEPTLYAEAIIGPGKLDFETVPNVNKLGDQIDLKQEPEHRDNSTDGNESGTAGVDGDNSSTSDNDDEEEEDENGDYDEDDDNTDDSSNTGEEQDKNEYINKRKNRAKEVKEHKEQQEEAIRKFYELKCVLCLTSFSTTRKLRVHFRDVHRRRAYVKCCNIKITAQPSRMLEHIKRHMSPQDFSCPQCPSKPFTTIQSLKKHLLRHDPKAKNAFICDKCGKNYAMKSRLRDHLLAHLSVEKRLNVCHICDKQFSCASNLNSHIRNIHENTNGYVCHICAKMLRTKTLLRFHSDTHLPSQRLKCNHVTCNVVLKSKKTLYAHLKQHQQQEEQICGICKKVCQNTRALKSHLRNVHSAATHRCSFCDKAFKLRRYLERHLASHSGAPLYPCAYCTKVYSYKSNMETHRKRKHLAEWNADRAKRLHQQ